MTSETTLHGLFPKEMFGCIIGAGGSRIKVVKEKNNVRITNDQFVVKEKYREVRIEGDWCSMWNAFCEIIKTIHEDERWEKRKEEPLIVQIKIQQSVAGKVIGKGGQNLKEWREMWPEAEFNVDNDDAEPELRYIRMRGDPFTLCEAAVKMADVLETALASLKQSGGGQKGAGGRGVPKRGRDNGGGFDDMGTHQMMPQQAMMMPIGAPAVQHMQAMQMNMQGMQPMHAMQQPMAMQGQTTKRRRTEQGEFQIMNANGQVIEPMKCSTAIVVDDSIIGKIIGAGGQVIKNMRLTTGAEIKTDGKGERKDGKREVIVSGSVQSVANALNMIHLQVLQSMGM